MRKARQVLRLTYESGLSVREIARSLGLSHSTVIKYLQKAKSAGLGWPLPERLDDGELESLLNPPREASDTRRELPDWVQVHKALRNKKACKGLTLHLIWEEYRRDHPLGYGYSQFCERYSRFKKALDPVMRQPYIAGEKLFVDWAGQTILILDPDGVRTAYLFVAALGASNYTYAEAFENMRLDSWIEAHIHTWEFLGGVTELTVPDNPKTAITTADRYEPAAHRTYEELAEHYGTVILPARGGKPQDKAKVEEAVQNAERRILAVLRDRQFFSLRELNEAIRKALDELNQRPFQKLPGCRADLFRELDQPALRPLPAQRYEIAQWRKAKVNIDYHVQFDWHYYSVPYRLIHQPVEVRSSSRVVEIFHQGRRVAAHVRSSHRGGFTTDMAHRPKAHQKHLQWTPSRLVEWARTQVGAQCALALHRLLEQKKHPEQGYRACLGIMRLRRHYGAERLEAACERAVRLDVCSYRSLQSILSTGSDRHNAGDAESGPVIVHPNLRGQTYYTEPCCETHTPPIERTAHVE